MSGKGGAKKKWGKGKAQKDKREWSTILTAEVAAELEKSVVRSRLITPAKLAERNKITLTVARKVLRQLEADGKIQRLAAHHTLDVYGRLGAADEPGAAEAAEAAPQAEASQKKPTKRSVKKSKKEAGEAEDEADDES
jgi:small subunit ribosomal protein S25e